MLIVVLYMVICEVVDLYCVCVCVVFSLELCFVLMCVLISVSVCFWLLVFLWVICKCFCELCRLMYVFVILFVIVMCIVCMLVVLVVVFVCCDLIEWCIWLNRLSFYVVLMLMFDVGVLCWLCGVLNVWFLFIN